jgi:hypothetical protein
MSLRLFLLVSLLGALLAGCVTTNDSDDDLNRMQRNHNAALETAA